MKSYGIKELVSKIIGKVYPVGETYEDESRFESLKELKDLLDYCVAEIYEVSLEAGRPEYSVSRAGNFARGYLRQLREDLDEKLSD